MPPIHSPLALDDARWNELTHRGGVGPNSEMDIVHELRMLLDSPHDLERIRDFWPYLASEGSTWNGAYAALPYLVQILKMQPRELRAELLSVIGIILTGADESSVPDYLLPAYLEALDEVYLPLGESLSVITKGDLPWVLATVSALRGNRELAELLQEPESFETTCEECDAEIYVQVPGLGD